LLTSWLGGFVNVIVTAIAPASHYVGDDDDDDDVPDDEKAQTAGFTSGKHG
jgi:hypothetical protein